MYVHWRFKLPMDPLNFDVCDEPGGVSWHCGPFKGNGEGLKEKGAPQELEEAVMRFDETTGLHAVMCKNPDRFFNTSGLLWVYTGGGGEAPDALGIDQQGNLVLGELKWQDGWHRRLRNQLERYEHLYSGDTGNRELHLCIAAAQTLSAEVHKNLNEVTNNFRARWANVTLTLGFLEVGWRAGVSDFYLRCRWEDRKGCDPRLHGKSSALSRRCPE